MTKKYTNSSNDNKNSKLALRKNRPHATTQEEIIIRNLPETPEAMDQEPIISNPSDVPEAMNQEIMPNPPEAMNQIMSNTSIAMTQDIIPNTPASINYNVENIENAEDKYTSNVNFGSFGANTPNNPGLMSNSNLDTPPRTTRNRSKSQNRSRL